MKRVFLFILLNSSYISATPSDSTLPGDKVISGSMNSPYIPGDQVIPHLDLSDVNIDDFIENSRRILRESTVKTIAPGAESAPVRTASVSPVQPVQGTGTKIKEPGHKRSFAAPRKIRQPVTREEPVRFPSGMRIIHQNLKYIGNDSYRKMVSLPNGSVAMGTLLSGVEVSQHPEDVLIQLDYAFIGPNGSVVEMSGCRMWASVTGDEATKRIKGSAEKITCMSESGRDFTVDGEAKIIDGSDEYMGVKGETVFYGKDSAMFLDFINSGLRAFGEAMAQFQVKTEIRGIENPTSVSNVTGDEAKYIAGKSLSGSMGKMMNWWVDYYMSLSPKIAVPTGTKVFMGIKGNMMIPEEFFGERIPTDYLKKMMKKTNSNGKMKGEIT
ncbi:MAG: hypothetical protein H6618_05120 [Deltaproteobacteria bacterium]|nr:hypothetical protein [Deltaproteobacteria bacterium]